MKSWINQNFFPCFKCDCGFFTLATRENPGELKNGKCPRCGAEVPLPMLVSERDTIFNPAYASPDDPRL